MRSLGRIVRPIYVESRGNLTVVVYSSNVLSLLGRACACLLVTKCIRGYSVHIKARERIL